MQFSTILKDASLHHRYQEAFLKKTIFPLSTNQYAFTLHAVTKARFHYPNDISIKSLPCYALLYTYEGTVSLHLGDTSYTLSPDTIAWFDCSYGFDIKITTTNHDWDYILLLVSGSSIPAYYSEFNKEHDIVISAQHSPNIKSIFSQIYTNVLSDTEDNAIIFSKLICDIITSLVLDRSIQTQYGEKPEYIIRIIQYIKKHYAERITLDSIAAHFALSKYSLSRDFTTYMHQSLIDYLIDYRIEESCKLLQFTTLTINEVSTATGFSTSNNFIQQFKKRTNLTPTAYRKQNQIYSSIQRLSDRYHQI